MKVKDLIEILNKVEDKELPVKILCYFEEVETGIESVEAEKDHIVIRESDDEGEADGNEEDEDED